MTTTLTTTLNTSTVSAPSRSSKVLRANGATVGIVVQNAYPHPTEVRPRKMAKTLSEHGYRVVILAENPDGSVRSERLAPRVTVRRFPPGPQAGPELPLEGARARWQGRLAKGHPWNLPWGAWIRRIAREEGLDLLISGNIGLGLQTGIVGRMLGIPVILDLFENNPGAVEARGKQRWYHHLTRNPALVDWIERACIRLADRTWVVAEENADRLMELGVEPSRLSLVGNTPLMEACLDRPRDRPEGRRRQGEGSAADPDARFRIVYVGVLHEFRGLDLILDAMPDLVSDGPGVELVIGGDGPHRSALEAKARALGVQDHVRFLGWVAASEVQPIISASDVGLISNRPSAHTQNTIPNKLFDYMAAAVPVVTTPLRPVARIVSGTRCGSIIPPDDPAEVAEVLRRLRRRPEDRREMGENGRRAVLTRYNWRVEEVTVLREIDRLLAEKDRTARPVRNEAPVPAVMRAAGHG